MELKERQERRDSLFGCDWLLGFGLSGFLVSQPGAA